MSGKRGERATGGSHSSYRHPVENDRIAEERHRRTTEERARYDARVAANLARRERERAEGKIA